MKKNVVILIFVFLTIIIVLLSIICFLLIFKNDDNKKNTKQKEKTIEERLKEAFVSEKYEQVTKNIMRKQIKENDGTGCLEQEFYSYDLKTNEFSHGKITEIDNECVEYDLKYYVALDTGDYLYTRIPKTQIYTINYSAYISENYDFNTGANNCNDGCSEIKQFKNKLISLLKKYKISIEEIK